MKFSCLRTKMVNSASGRALQLLFGRKLPKTGDTLVIEEHVGTITKVVFNGKELPLMTKSKL